MPTFRFQHSRCSLPQTSLLVMKRSQVTAGQKLSCLHNRLLTTSSAQNFSLRNEALSGDCWSEARLCNEELTGDCLSEARAVCTDIGPQLILSRMGQQRPSLPQALLFVMNRAAFISPELLLRQEYQRVRRVWSHIWSQGFCCSKRLGRQKDWSSEGSCCWPHI